MTYSSFKILTDPCPPLNAIFLLLSAVPLSLFFFQKTTIYSKLEEIAENNLSSPVETVPLVSYKDDWADKEKYEEEEEETQELDDASAAVTHGSAFGVRFVK